MQYEVIYKNNKYHLYIYAPCIPGAPLRPVAYHGIYKTKERATATAQRIITTK